MVPLLIEFKLDMETFLNADFHLDLLMFFLFLFHDVVDDEFLLLCNAIVVTIDTDVDEVAYAHVDAIVRLKLFLNSIERKIVRHVVSERPWRLQVTNELSKDRVMILVEVILDDADEFDSDAHVIQLLVLEQIDSDLPSDVLSILNASHKHTKRRE